MVIRIATRITTMIMRQARQERLVVVKTKLKKIIIITTIKIQKARELVSVFLRLHAR